MNIDKKVLGIIIVLVAIASFLGGATFTQWQSERQVALSLSGEVTPTPTAQGTEEQAEVLGELTSTIGNFLVLEEEICEEDGKPTVYFFGSERCPHCSWEHPIFEEVMGRFEDLVSFHNNMDKDTDREVFQKYGQINQGGIPFMVLGCRYAKVGSGERAGEEQEEKVLTAITCKLTDGQPEEVCTEVEDLIEQID